MDGDSEEAATLLKTFVTAVAAALTRRPGGSATQAGYEVDRIGGGDCGQGTARGSEGRTMDREAP